MQITRCVVDSPLLAQPCCGAALSCGHSKGILSQVCFGSQHGQERQLDMTSYACGDSVDVRFEAGVL